MLDGKSRIELAGRKGAYCYMCSMTKEDYHTIPGVMCKVGKPTCKPNPILSLNYLNYLVLVETSPVGLPPKHF